MGRGRFGRGVGLWVKKADRHGVGGGLIRRRAPPGEADARAVHDLTTLGRAEAAALDGRRGRFRVAIDSPPSDRLGCVCYGCATPDGVERTLFLRDGEADRDRLEVEGTLRVLHHPAAVCGKTAFVGFTEYRLVDADRRQVRP